MVRFSKKDDINKKIEQAVGDIVGKIWNVEFKEYPSLHPIDFWCEQKGRILYHAEIKGRNQVHDEYDTVMFAMKKWLNMLVSVYHSEIPACVLFHFYDGIYVIDVLKIKPEYKMGVSGRRFSRYSNREETEPVVYIPVEDLQLISRETYYSRNGIDYREMVGEKSLA